MEWKKCKGEFSVEDSLVTGMVGLILTLGDGTGCEGDDDGDEPKKDFVIEDI